MAPLAGVCGFLLGKGVSAELTGSKTFLRGVGYRGSESSKSNIPNVRTQTRLIPWIMLSKYHTVPFAPVESKAAEATSPTSTKVLRGVSKDGEFRNWAASVQTAPAKVLKPKTVRDIQGILAQVTTLQMQPPFTAPTWCNEIWNTM